MHNPLGMGYLIRIERAIATFSLVDIVPSCHDRSYARFCILLILENFRSVTLLICLQQFVLPFN